MTEEAKTPPRMPPGFVQYLTEEDMERHRRLLAIEADLSRMVKHKQAWQLVVETMKKAAMWLSAIAAGLYALREILRSHLG